MTAPTWTSTPPSEAGIYWARRAGDWKSPDTPSGEAEVVRVSFYMGAGRAFGLGEDECYMGLDEFALWWPVPLQPPPQ